MADDWDAGGPVREVCRGYEHAPRGAVVHLRLLAGVFRLVLTGRAPELVRFYPCLGGTAPASQVWPVMRHEIGAHVEEMHAALAVPPQTNEVGRSAALLAGLFDLVATSGVRRIRLLELGASAGLNLLLPTEEITAVRSILTNYGAQQRLGEVSLEYDFHDQRAVEPELRIRLWNPDAGTSIRERLIGTAHDHGIP
jgi:hypothetical protein